MFIDFHRFLMIFNAFQRTAPLPELRLSDQLETDLVRDRGHHAPRATLGLSETSFEMPKTLKTSFKKLPKSSQKSQKPLKSLLNGS